MTRWPQVRDVLLFFGGMGGFGHELILAKSERPTLLILCAAMMGLPAFLSPRESPSETPPQPTTDTPAHQENA